MLLHIEDFEPAPTDDFICYPGRLPKRSYVYSENGLFVLSEQTPLEDAAATLQRLNSTPLDDRIPVLAYGSNANPVQIAKKMAGLDADRTVPLLLGEVAELTPVYAGHIATYGAIPATLDLATGEHNRIFLAFFTLPQLEVTITSEHGNYALCGSRHAQIYLPGLDRPLPFYTFVSHKGVLVLNGEPVPLKSLNEEEVVSAVLQEIADEEGVPSYDVYRKDPLPYRTAIANAIGHLGLRRANRNQWEELQLSALKTYSRIN